MKSEEKNNNSSMLLALLLFIGAGILIVGYLFSDNLNSEKKLVKSARFEKSVNRHLMMTNDRIQMEQQKMQIESERMLNRGAGIGDLENVYRNENVLDLSHDQRAQDVAQEIGRGQREVTADSPGDIIQREVMSQQQLQEYSEEYKKEYARQFVENARQGGYQVILSKDLSRVISVKPIREKGMKLPSSAYGTSSPLQ